MSSRGFKEQSTARRSNSRKSGPNANTYESVIEGYDNVEIIGKGSFGSIRKVKRKLDGKLFARKELNFDRMSERDRLQIVAEVNILRTLKHSNIVQYEERCVDHNTGYVQMCWFGHAGEELDCSVLTTLAVL